MKNYGLQVKEIPIIFRGGIDQSEIRDSEINVTVDSTIAQGNHFIPNRFQIGTNLTKALNSADSVDISFNNEIFKNVKSERYNQTSVYFGAPAINDFTGNVDFSVFPFSIMASVYSPNSTAAYLVTKESISSLNIKIWINGEMYIISKKIFSADLTGNGQINHFRARFACGENGTLHLRPYVILNGNIRVNLCNFAQGGDQYIAGDNEEIEFDCFVPIETHATAYVEAENTGEYPSLVDAAMTVQYEDFIESESIVGYEGVNLRRGRR